MADTDLAQALFDTFLRAAALPPWIDAVVVLRAGPAEQYTVRIVGGRPALAVGPDDEPDLTVDADLATLTAIARGGASGVDAFLEGRLRLRGNLALSLRLAALWDEGAEEGYGLHAGDVEVEGKRTFYLDAGEGPAVVLLHGLGATNASMLPLLTRLARDHRVLAPDLPGFGDSDKPLRPLHAAYYAHWLRGLLDELGIERAHVIGNSMGGRVAVEAGLRHPDRVDRLVLLAPSPAFLRKREFVRIVRLLRPELAVVPLPLPHAYVRRSIQRMFADPSRLHGDWYDAGADEFLRVFNGFRGRVCFFSAARQIYLEEPHGKPGGFWERLPDLSAPALFLWGAQDALVPAKFAGYVEQALPSARSIVLDDCGHVPQFEQPEQVGKLIDEFLDR